MKKILLTAVLAVSTISQVNAEDKGVSSSRTYKLEEAINLKNGRNEPFYTYNIPLTDEHGAGELQTCASVIDETGKKYDADDSTESIVTGYDIACKHSKQ